MDNEEKVKILQDDVAKIKHTLWEGNGTPPILVRLNSLENNLNFWMNDTKENFELLRNSIDMKLSQVSSKIENKLLKIESSSNAEKVKINNSIDKLTNDVESINARLKNYNEYKAKYGLAWLAFIGTILTAIINSFVTFIR